MNQWPGHAGGLMLPALWPIDDPTEEPAPLICPGCGAVGWAPCAHGCVYHDVSAEATTLADRWHDEQASSDADPWEDVF